MTDSNTFKPSLLYIDDDDTILETFQMALDSDFEVYCAHSGGEGFNILKEHPVDIILTDQYMPNMTGVEFLERVSREYPDIHCYMVSGYKDFDAVTDAINKGKIKGFFTKPYDMDALLDTLYQSKETLKIRSTTKEPVSPTESCTHTRKSKKNKKNITQLIKQCNDGIALLKAVLQKETIDRSQINYYLDHILQSAHNQLEKEFFQLSQQAQSGLKVKKDFIATINHEIRTPMNAILGLLHFLKKTISTPKQLEYIDKIRTSSNELLSIINDLLDFSKIKTGKLTVSTTSFDMIKIINNLTNIIRKKVHKKNIKIIFDIKKDMYIDLIGDPLRIGQILLNLINNAVKFTNEGTITIIIDMEKQTENDKIIDVKFIIKDTGIGIAAEDQKKIYEAFYQGDTSLTRKYGGLGLGLSITLDLIEQMNGSIDISSIPEKGSVFTVVLPLHLQENKQKRNISLFNTIAKGFNNKKSQEKNTRLNDPITSEVMGLEAVRGKKILLIDNNDINLHLIQDLLEMEGMEVTAVGSGEEALLLLSRDIAFDLVLLNLQMPVMNGFDTTMQIRRSLLNDETLPIIAMTDDIMHELIKALKETGMNDYLLKPIDPRELYNILIKWIKPNQ